MTHPNVQTLDNFKDTGRVIPTSALSSQVMTEAEGSTIEQITGPAGSGSVELSRKVASLTFLLAHDGAGALEAGGASPAALAIPPLADFSAQGTTLTNLNARDYSGSLLLVVYKADVPAEAQSTRGTVTP